MWMLTLALAASSIATLGSAQTPAFYCAYDCTPKPSPPGQCTSGYCPRKSPEGCLLIPLIAPHFQTEALCNAFAAKKPTCHVGGSCYVNGGLPELSAEWQHGFIASLHHNQTMWQYGLDQHQNGMRTSVAMDPEGQQILNEAEGADPAGHTFYTASLLLGAQKRMYNFMNSSVSKQCVYQELNASTAKLIIDMSTFKNFTFYRDAEVNGEQVRIFRYVPPLVESSAVVSNSDSDAQGATPLVPRHGPHPTPSHHSVSMSVSTGPGDLILRRPSLQPLRMESAHVLPRSEWDQLGGFQGMSSTASFDKIKFGRPPADLFKVPSAWLPCKKMPTPPQVMHVVPLLGASTLPHFTEHFAEVLV